ncbi:hypothetical protein RND81_06G030800 [Saponaria officinalis]|uniref:Uncharacterized protein n=1 Tax=Saponaria officinalis TaxID=3572 RepID=A0AAW1K960_SAPOF
MGSMPQHTKDTLKKVERLYIKKRFYDAVKVNDDHGEKYGLVEGSLMLMKSFCLRDLGEMDKARDCYFEMGKQSALHCLGEVEGFIKVRNFNKALKLIDDFKLDTTFCPALKSEESYISLLAFTHLLFRVIGRGEAGVRLYCRS